MHTLMKTFLFQYPIFVLDRGNSRQLRSDVSVTINVIRDSDTLRFVRDTYNGQIDEGRPMGFGIVTTSTIPSVSQSCYHLSYEIYNHG